MVGLVPRLGERGQIACSFEMGRSQVLRSPHFKRTGNWCGKSVCRGFSFLFFSWSLQKVRSFCKRPRYRGGIADEMVGLVPRVEREGGEIACSFEMGRSQDLLVRGTCMQLIQISAAWKPPLKTMHCGSLVTRHQSRLIASKEGSTMHGFQRLFPATVAREFHSRFSFFHGASRKRGRFARDRDIGEAFRTRWWGSCRGRFLCVDCSMRFARYENASVSRLSERDRGVRERH